MRSSLHLEILMYFNRAYVGLLFLLTVCTFAYKDSKFPYPNTYLGTEVFCFVCYTLAEIFRLYLGSFANKTENSKLMGIFTILGIGALMLNVYFVNWQTFVLKIDVISHSIAIGIIGLQILLGMFSALSFMGEKDDDEDYR
eukprot:CAMPEP_0170170038 /NCGR_PEP_ID=MMETSP0040_2-20121228/2971_1 /TAXON_ID=641309 /ORGANISM="Lotharella oceanica, Strain CCMP622" /LENGTH=140 /DNA_ID=CAMNT_0010409163 /DNA_START=101 /DNA_END=523 /DNA_ORIENTATION=-